MQALLSEKDVKLVATVEGHEEFDEVTVSHDEASGEHDFGHIIQVAHGNEIFQAVGFAKRNGEREHHGETGINRASNEVGRENSGMPAGNDGHREIEAHHGMHGKNQRRGESGKKQIGRLVAVPVACGIAPTHGEYSVDHLLVAALRTIPQGGEVWEQTYKPEEQRNCPVSRYRKNVPDERATELRPDSHGAGVREHVVSHPGTAGVNQREQTSAGHGEEGHGFGEPVNGSAPLLVQQEENGRNQRTGVADTDPPNEIDNGEAPANGDVNAPDSDALNNQPGNRDE